MAARRLIPSMNRVLVEKLLQPNKSAGGILLPETTKQVPMRRQRSPFFFFSRMDVPDSLVY